MFTAGVITVSDKGYKGEREDTSGKAIMDILKREGFRVKHYKIVPDEKQMIKKEIIKCCDRIKLNLIVTTGGTGLSKRDVTPEATRAVLDFEIPGFAEAMRLTFFAVTPTSILSRGISGVRGDAFVVNLPGSRKAVIECLNMIMPALKHGIETRLGISEECGKHGKDTGNRSGRRV